MADYDCFPLWTHGGPGTVNLDPATLPITPELAAALLRWADEYDGTLDRDDPASSGFPDPAVENAFYERGAVLARRLAGELGRQVVYFDGLTGRDVPVTAQA